MVSVFDRLIAANRRQSTPFSNFFTFEQQQQRLKNVAKTFGFIGNNVLQGNLFKGVPVSQEFDETQLGRIATAISSPAAIVTLPAAAGAVRLGISSLAARQAAASSSASVAKAVQLSRLLPSIRSSSQLAALGLGGATVFGGFKAANNFGRGGLSGLVTGSDTIDVNRQRSDNETANIDTVGDAVTEAVLRQLGEGTVIGVDSQGNAVAQTPSGQEIPLSALTNLFSGTPNQPINPSGFSSQINSVLSASIPVLAIVFGGLVLSNLTKKR